MFLFFCLKAAVKKANVILEYIRQTISRKDEKVQALAMTSSGILCKILVVHMQGRWTQNRAGAEDGLLGWSKKMESRSEGKSVWFAQHSKMKTGEDLTAVWKCIRGRGINNTECYLKWHTMITEEKLAPDKWKIEHFTFRVVSLPVGIVGMKKPASFDDARCIK